MQWFGFSGLVACSHGLAQTDLSTERETLYVAICVCNVFGFRYWSRAGMLVSPELDLSTERVTFYVAICVFTVLGFRDWSHAGMLVSPKRILRSKITGL